MPQGFARGLIMLAVAISVEPMGMAAHADGFVTLYTFTGIPNGSSPYANLIADPQGNLYGTTYFGGQGCDLGCGTVFKLTPQGQELILYSFKGRADGASPRYGLIMDAENNLYGAADAGGARNKGVVFRLSPDGKETVLHTFGTGRHDGHYPSSGLIADGRGNFYGTTSGGGIRRGCSGDGCGTVYKILPDGTERVLYRFQGGIDGSIPLGGVIRDKAGNLYGATEDGGSSDGCGKFGCGTVYRIDRHRNKATLYNFTSGNDGESPRAGLVMDSAGNLYGTTSAGGGGRCGGGMCGVVFKITPQGTESVLHAFADGSDGSDPEAGLIIDKSGALYGTTFDGGQSGNGVLFKIDSNGVETVLHAFDGDNGAQPAAALLNAHHHTLIGTASSGGLTNQGTVFTIAN